MSQAEELLRGLNGDEAAAYTVRSVAEPHIVIGTDRVIRVPDELKRLAVQFDHNIETVTFDCPRFWDEHDMSTMKIYINYRTYDKRLGSYPARNVTVDGDIMHFDWTISGHVSKVQGNLAFLVCIRKTDDEGNEANHWNSELCTNCYISEGLETTETVLSENSDTITFLLTRMDEVNAIATPEAMQEFANSWLNANSRTVLAEIETKGEETLATIPADYTETYNAAQEALRTKADAVMLEVDGETLVVNNSSNDHVKGLKLFGKTRQVVTTGAQLFDGRKLTNLTLNGVTMTNDGTGVIAMAGTASTAWSSVNIRIEGLTPGTYCVSGMIEGKIFFYVRVTLSDGTYKYYKAPNQFTLDGTEQEVLGYLYAPTAGAAFSGEKIYPMLNAGDSPLPWEPYSGRIASPSPGWSQELDTIQPDVHIYGKNLARLGAALDVSVSGLSIVGGSNDSQVVINGTTEKVFSHVIMRSGLLPPGKYTISVHGLNYHDAGNDRMYVTRKGDNALLVNYIQEGAPKTINLTDYSELKVDAVFAAGSVYNNRTVSVQIEAGEIATEYEPYTPAQIYQVGTALPGVPVTSGGNYTDPNGQQWVCDEIDFESNYGNDANHGVYVKRVGVKTFDGSTDEIWYDELDLENTTMFRIEIPDSANVGNIAAYDFLCNCLQAKQIYNSDKVGLQHTMKQFYFRLANSELTSIDLTGWRAWLAENPVTVQYVLANPVETPLTEAELATFLKLKTNYHNTTAFNTEGAYMAMKYIADTKIYISEYQPEISDERLNAAVHAWLEAHFVNAEGVSY